MLEGASLGTSETLCGCEAEGMPVDCIVLCNADVSAGSLVNVLGGTDERPPFCVFMDVVKVPEELLSDGLSVMREAELCGGVLIVDFGDVLGCLVVSLKGVVDALG